MKTYLIYEPAEGWHEQDGLNPRDAVKRAAFGCNVHSANPQAKDYFAEVFELVDGKPGPSLGRFCISSPYEVRQP